MGTSAEPRAPARSAWFPVVAPFVAWALHVALCIVVTLTACGGTHAVVASRLAILAVGAGALAVTVASLFKARAALERGDGQPERFEGSDASVRQFVARLGLSSSIVFGIAVLWTMLPGVLVTRLCEVGR